MKNEDINSKNKGKSTMTPTATTEGGIIIPGMPPLCSRLPRHDTLLSDHVVVSR